MLRCIRGFILACVLIILTAVLGIALLVLYGLYRPWVKSCYDLWIRYVRWMMHTQCVMQVAPIVDQPNQGHILMANHQSWLDILVLLAVFETHIPPLRFVMKDSLQWVPVVGLICRVLGYPLIDRTKPKKAYQQLKHSVHTSTEVSTWVIFPEGTRFHPSKTTSPHAKVLIPKPAGLFTLIQLLKDHHPTILDVTIQYQGASSFLAFFQGNIPHMTVHHHTVIPPEDKKAFSHWLKSLWHQKFVD